MLADLTGMSVLAVTYVALKRHPCSACLKKANPQLLLSLRLRRHSPNSYAARDKNLFCIAACRQNNSMQRKPEFHMFYGAAFQRSGAAFIFGAAGGTARGRKRQRNEADDDCRPPESTHRANPCPLHSSQSSEAL
jgi:hypothetical protein